MTTAATMIRDAVFDRIATRPEYIAKRKTPVPQLQPDDLPALSVFIAGEQLVPDGDDNAGEPHFQSLTTIAISVVRGFEDPAVLSGAIDADVDAIEARLLTDPSFIKFGPDALFDAVTSIKRRRLYPQAGKDGEAYFAELRLEITFRTLVDFEPDITTTFEGATMTVRPNVSGKMAVSGPQIIVGIDPPQP